MIREALIESNSEQKNIGKEHKKKYVDEEFKYTAEANALKEELESKYVFSVFYFYEPEIFKDSEESEENEMLVTLINLKNRVQSFEELPDKVELEDLVMTDSYSLGDKNERKLMKDINNKGEFEVESSIEGEYPEKHYYGFIDINGKKQRIIYKHAIGGFVYYYLFSKDVLK